MIGRLVGQVADWDADGILFDVGGVGYEVACAPPTIDAMRAAAGPVVLWVVTEVREDAFDLYGFRSREEKGWYRTLRGVQGVGPRAALALLATLRPADLMLALGSGDKTALTRAPGVGPKLAARLVTELKDKVGAMGLAASGGAALSDPAPAAAAETAADGLVADAVSALTNLGYGRSDAFRAVAAEQQALGEDAALNALIRGSLKRLSAQ